MTSILNSIYRFFFPTPHVETALMGLTAVVAQLETALVHHDLQAELRTDAARASSILAAAHEEYAAKAAKVADKIEALIS